MASAADFSQQNFDYIIIGMSNHVCVRFVGVTFLQEAEQLVLHWLRCTYLSWYPCSSFPSNLTLGYCSLSTNASVRVGVIEAGLRKDDEMILVPGEGSDSDWMALNSRFFSIPLGAGMVGKAVGSESVLVLKDSASQFEFRPRIWLESRHKTSTICSESADVNS
jgi:hypothetical protein